MAMGMVDRATAGMMIWARASLKAFLVNTPQIFLTGTPRHIPFKRGTVTKATSHGTVGAIFIPAGAAGGGMNACPPFRFSHLLP